MTSLFVAASHADLEPASVTDEIGERGTRRTTFDVNTVRVEVAVNRRHVVWVVSVEASVAIVVETIMGGGGARRPKSPSERVCASVDKVAVL